MQYTILKVYFLNAGSKKKKNYIFNLRALSMTAQVIVYFFTYAALGNKLEMKILKKIFKSVS